MSFSFRLARAGGAQRAKFGDQEGSIVFWKSHLLHGFSRPNAGENRVTLSFNIMPKICTTGDQYSFVVDDEI